jgi:hypothetical protein
VRLDWGTCFLDHFGKYFGDFGSRRVFTPDETAASIQILAYAKVFAGCLVFSSLGLSHYEAEVGGPAEAVLPVDEAWDIVPEVFASSLFFMVRNRLPVGRGVSIRGIDNLFPRFSAEYGKSAVYLTNPYNLPAEFSTVPCGAERGSVFLAFLISAREDEYFRANGAEVFEEHLEAAKVDPFSLRRPCSINSDDPRREGPIHAGVGSHDFDESN